MNAKRDKTAYIRDIEAHLRRVENCARFAEFYGADVKTMREVRALAEAMRKRVSK